MPATLRLPTLALSLLLGTVLATPAQTVNPPPATPPPQPAAPALETATLGAGCFWCVEAVFERLPGVKSVTSGYTGGRTANPTYEDICTGLTGHAEVTQVEFDPKVISFSEILDVFWQSHDPTTLNRQGADVGTQYRSAIFYHGESQKLAAEKSKKAAQADFDRPIVTEITAAGKFYKAENYHQDYFRNNPNNRYCTLVIRPKLEKLDKLKEKGKAPKTP
ncbi:MAG: peptide-methionine (S)-S-oxide reductase MsrA [Verrucomicrobiota bacterium]